MNADQVCAAAAALAICALSALPSEGATVTVALGGGGETTLATKTVGTVLVADLAAAARDLDLLVQLQGDRAVIRDSDGVVWRAADGSLLLEGPSAPRVLESPAVVRGGAVYLPLQTIARLAGRTLVINKGDVVLMRTTSGGAGSADVRGPAGWQTVSIRKTAAELAEMRRLEGESAPAAGGSVLHEILPPRRESLTLDVGLGYAQGMSGAADLTAAGTASGIQIQFNTFLTYGRDGALYRNGRVMLAAPGESWRVEAGDLLSDVRGLVRGVRFGRAIRPSWRPSVSLYAPSAASSVRERTAVAYRDDLQITRSVGLRLEAGSDKAGFVAGRWVQGRASLETFARRAPSRLAREAGATASYDVWHGITGTIGARVSNGQLRERWYFGGITVPVANVASVTLERTRSNGPTRSDTNAFGVQLPLGRIRVMQRYQWTDIGFLGDLSTAAPGRRQLQSMASYSPVRRVQLTYQVATQWYASVAARQSTELQGVVTLSRSTSLHGVSGFPDIANRQHFRVGIQQTLPRGFRLAADYGALPAFQTSIVDRQEHPRFLVLVRRNLAVATPAKGATVVGRVVGAGGEPIPGAPVTLGPYVTAAGADGGYRFVHVPAGEYELRLNKARLAVRYASDGVAYPVHASAGSTTRLDLHALPLYAIYGHVFVDRNGNGVFDRGEGVANVVMRLSPADRATMTDEDGAYGFYNLPPGAYDVRVDSERLSAALSIVSAPAIAVDLEAAGTARTGLDFRVSPRDKPIVIQRTLPQ